MTAAMEFQRTFSEPVEALQEAQYLANMLDWPFVVIDRGGELLVTRDRCGRGEPALERCWPVDSRGRHVRH